MYFGRQHPDFIATLKYLKSEQGGRKKPISKVGYRPLVKFPEYIISTTSEQLFLDKEVVFPGDTVEAEMTILYIEYFQNKLFVGQTFEIREGQTHVIGTGQIKKIINKNLEIK